MKSLMAMLVLVVAVPAMATVNFTAVGTDDGSGKFTIAYTTTDGDAPRGVALRISASDGATVDMAAPLSVDLAFNAFIDYAYSNPLNYAVGAGHPLAKATEAGALQATDVVSDFSVSMGVLDQNGGQLPGPTTTTNLITIKLNKGTADQSTVTISADTLRGPASGVVGSVLNSNLTPPLTCVVKFGVIECVKPEASFFNDWVAWEKPLCWCYERQCRGDINGTSFGGRPVSTADLNIFKAAFNKVDADLKLVANGICADLNHASFGGRRCSTADLNILKANFNKVLADVPACDLAPNYNFWVTP